MLQTVVGFDLCDLFFVCLYCEEQNWEGSRRKKAREEGRREKKSDGEEREKMIYK